MPGDQDPLEPTPDPTGDTPEKETEDTAEDTDSGQTDWTPKDRGEAIRKITELGQENARLRREAEQAEAQPDDDAEGAQGDGPEDDYLGQQNALLAVELFGPEVADAAEAVWDNLERASTTADYMAALEAYHQARLGGSTAAEAGAKGGKTAKGEAPTRDEVTRPRVDTNRDGSPDSDDKLAEARKTGSLSGFATGVAEALGFGSGKRPE
jgi:hypothetical protein